MIKFIQKNKKSILCVAVVFMFLCVLTVFALACGSYEDGSNQVPGVAEPDIVKITTDGYIIKLQKDGMTVTKTDDGQLTVVKRKKSPRAQKPIDLIAYDKYMIAVVQLDAEYTQLQFYDMVDLNDGTNRIEPIRETSFFGTYFTCRIYDASIYFIAASSNQYRIYDEKKGQYVDTNKKDVMVDSVEGEKQFFALNSAETSSGYLLAKLDLTDIAANKYTLTTYRDSTLSSLYFSKTGIYLVLDSLRSEGCGSTPEFVIVKISIDNLRVFAKSDVYEGRLINRYCLYDNGERLFAVSYYDSTALRVFNNNMRQVAYIDKIAPGESVTAVKYEEDFCYIVTYREVDPLFKIDISDADNPVLTGYVKVEGFSTNLLSFGENLLIGVGKNGSQVQLTLFDTEDDAPYEVNNIVLGITHTEALTNPKAVCNLPEKNIFAITTPYNIYIFSIDYYGYLELTGILSMTVLENVSDTSLWLIDRTVCIGDYLYTVADGAIASYSIDGLKLVSSVDTRI